MTAKEALREIVDDLTEEQAEQWLRAADPRATEELLTEVARLSAQELMQLPAQLRAAILGFAARIYSPDDAAEDLALWKTWEAGTGKDVHLIDG